MTPLDPDGNIFSAFASAAAKNGNKTAIIYLGTRFTYKTILRRVENFAASLKDAGVTEGERIVLYVPNSVHWVIAWLGIQRAGAVVVPITPIYTKHDLVYIANDSGAKHIVCSVTNFGYVKQAIPETGLKKAIAIKLTDLLPWRKRLFGWAFDRVPKGKVSREDDTLWFGNMVKNNPRAKDLPQLTQKGTDTAEIIYTGGTTKFPKGVPITHGLYLESAGEQISICDPLFKPEENVVLGSAPLFHILGQTCALSTLLVGGAIVLMPKVNLDAIFDAVHRHKAKTLIGVPTLYRMILDHDRIDFYDLSSLMYAFNGGDVLPEEISNRWRKKFNKPIYQGYGATETCGGVTMCHTDEENPPKSIGRVVPSKTVKLVDPATLKPVAPGEQGEALVHSDRMVKAYWNKPEETKEAFVEIDGDLYYRTADVLTIDEEGRYYFVDRTVDTIKH
ncbi:MAG TPA: long-chain fatty acid--CoA ligase, partial [Desulfobacteria bacterium]|nr:long-chain fatty acid--CoA ligase [Desulfobacteria bacterium]